MTLIEKLESLHGQYHDDEQTPSSYMAANLRAIIEEYKNAKPVVITTEMMAHIDKSMEGWQENTRVEVFHPPQKDGYKLVPIEPTPEMIEAGDKVAEIHNEYGVDLYIENTREVYKAMIDEAMKADNVSE